MRVSRIMAHAGLEFRLMVRQGENVVLSFGIPLAMLVIAAFVPAIPHPDHLTAIDWMTPGVLAVCVMSSGMVTLGITTGFERYYRVIQRFGATPLTRWEFFSAKALAIVGILMLQVALTMLVAWPLGYSGSLGGVLAMLPVILLGLVVFAGIGFFIAGHLPAMAALAVLNALFIVCMSLAGIAYDVHNLSETAQTLLSLVPAMPLVELLRWTSGLSTVSTVPWLGLASLGIWAVLCPWAAVRSFRYS